MVVVVVVVPYCPCDPLLILQHYPLFSREKKGKDLWENNMDSVGTLCVCMCIEVSESA